MKHCFAKIFVEAAMWWISQVESTEFAKLFRRSIAEQKRTADNLAIIAVELKKLVRAVSRPPNPGLVSLFKTGENMNIINFDVNLPVAPVGADIQSGELTVVVEGGATTVIATAKDDVVVKGLSAEQDSVVTLSFVYIDDAGNRSVTPSVLVVKIADTVPPPDAGVLGVTVTGEV